MQRAEVRGPIHIWSSRRREAKAPKAIPNLWERAVKQHFTIPLSNCMYCTRILIYIFKKLPQLGIELGCPPSRGVLLNYKKMHRVRIEPVSLFYSTARKMHPAGIEHRAHSYDVVHVRQAWISKPALHDLRHRCHL